MARKSAIRTGQNTKLTKLERDAIIGVVEVFVPLVRDLAQIRGVIGVTTGLAAPGKASLNGEHVLNLLHHLDDNLGYLVDEMRRSCDLFRTSCQES